MKSAIVFLGLMAFTYPQAASCNTARVKTTAADLYQSGDFPSSLATTLSLSRRKSSSQSQRHKRSNVPRHLDSKDTSSSMSIRGSTYTTPITFGTQSFEVSIDTGSSNTWVVGTGFSCLEPDTGDTGEEAKCRFGKTYDISDTFAQVEDGKYETQYASEESLTGIIGLETIGLAGISVRATVAIAQEATWTSGDGRTSGLLGLAYPSSMTMDGDAKVYDPIFTTMYKQNLTSPMFSMAILRGDQDFGGYLTFGGLPPVEFVDDFTSTPIVKTGISSLPEEYNFYRIKPNGLSVDGAFTDQSHVPYDVDSGAPLNYMPADVADTINAAFSPAATLTDDGELYSVDCNATAPIFSVLTHSPEDTTSPCVTGFAKGRGEGLYILGDAFMRNVITVFDVGAVQMRFAARENYTASV